MKEYKNLKINGTMLEKSQLDKHLEKIASTHNLSPKSEKSTYPVPNLIKDFEYIKEVYKLLNEHLKLEITIHPAGEWLLDNFYIIEETVKQIQNELSIKKYTNFVGIQTGEYKGFARIYVLAEEIVAYTDCKIEKENLEEYLKSYQQKRTLSMDEIWNIGIFLEIAIIQKIKDVCEKIASSQMQKYKVEDIAERLIENKEKSKLIYKSKNNNYQKNVLQNIDMKYPFIEYMSYTLKRYGKKGIGYLNILEDIVEKQGTTVSDVIQKEHFDIAIQKVLMGNSITSIKKIQRINFLEIFEKINGVEDILRKDPANVYEKMDYTTKEYYRNKIKEISNKTKMSEIYIARKILELAEEKANQCFKQGQDEEVDTKESKIDFGQRNNINVQGESNKNYSDNNDEDRNQYKFQKENNQENQKINICKDMHIGYYLIDEGINELYKKLEYSAKKERTPKQKTKIYIAGIAISSIVITFLLSYFLSQKLQNIWIFIISAIIFFIPSTELSIQVLQYILSKCVKPKLIPKMDFSKGITKENATMVIIPTIVDSIDKVKELVKKLEVAYVSNESKNLYFTLLGDCTQSRNQEEKIDQDIMKTGKEEVKKLNKKYPNEEFPIFNFIYRKRIWNEKEDCYLGWERKRGMINQFNEYLLKNIENPFRENTIEKYQKENKVPKIKYIITLDADTDLILETASKLVGAMAHILNLPQIDEDKNIVIKGYGIMQPRVGVNLQISYKNLFTKIFAGAGGIDCYTNAISDIYQDNFKEGIFTGKGIYDLEVFSKVLSKEIPENTVLSHDLLEGCYLRCGLVSDIMLMDGYPCKYNSFMNRLSRWIRGDWQICNWLFNKKLNMLSKFKILDNLRRSLLEISLILSLLVTSLIGIVYEIKIFPIICVISLIIIIPFILELLNMLIFKKEGEEKQKTFTPKISGVKGAIIRAILTLGCLPYKAYISAKAVVKTIYRKLITKKHMLEWTTSEEAEKQAKTDIFSYYYQMGINVISAIICIVIGVGLRSVYSLILAFLWLITPAIMQNISTIKNKKKQIDELNNLEKEEVKQIAEKTWKFFKDNLNEENNYLITDNIQEDRIPQVVPRTSSTNIGLSLLAVVSAYDLNFIDEENAIEYLNKIILSIESLPKWNGHLYNWYNTKTKEPLLPRYISTVDSGNFIGYLYTIKPFLEELDKKIMSQEREIDESVEKSEGKSKQEDKENKSLRNLKQMQEKIENCLRIIIDIIKTTDFSLLYSKEHQLFSIGYNIEENKLTDSYYDLLASEARQASFVAIAKKDVPVKHWNSLSRTLTVLGKYKGLISWSGTSFEYLMPNINMPKYEGSLLDESCKFMILSQMKYAKELNIPWGISEAAFNLKDLQGNYQYKAFGVPWLGLKRGLADEMVVSSYGGILAIFDEPKKVVNNIKRLKEYGVEGKYGLYESIDFTPERLKKGETGTPVKTFMAHHQALILLSINNLFNNNIFQNRFMQNPEIEGTSILLQETMPEKAIITKENKEKIEKPKYKDYEDYIEETYTKIDERLIRGNVISNENYIIAMNQKGEGFSKYKNIYINRFKVTDDYPQGIFFAVKNIKTKSILTSNYTKDSQYKVTFAPDKVEQEITKENLKAKIETIVATKEPLEIRKMTLENLGNEEEIVEVTAYFEPVLSRKEQEYAHPVFNNLFLINSFDEETNSLIIKRKKREAQDKEIYLAVNLVSNAENIGELEYEIDEEKFVGRGNLGIPQMIKNSNPLSKKIGLVTEPVVALKRNIKIKPNEKISIALLISVEENKQNLLENIKKYKINENVEKAFALSKAGVEANSRYLRIKGKELKDYQKILSYIIFKNPAKKLILEKLPKRNYMQSDLWKYGISGDLPLILVKIKDVNDAYILKEVLKMYEFIRTKKIDVEIVILDEERHSYENYVREEIENIILNEHMSYLRNIKGGIFELNKNDIEKRDREILELVSSIIIDSNKGGIKNTIQELEEEYLDKEKNTPDENKVQIMASDETKSIDILKNGDLKYENELGGFSPDGKEYNIRIDKNNRTYTVWSHILANEKFGTLVTENMGGYTWYKNCRLNRVTSWENKPNSDIPSEVIYIKDVENKKVWSIGANPKPDEKTYNIIYGFGYAKYLHQSDGIEQCVEIFVPKEDSIKIQIVTLKNQSANRKKLKLYYYAKPVLGEDEFKSNGYINLKYDENNNIITLRNLYNSEFPNDITYVSSSEKINSYTGDKDFFLGTGGLENPEGIQKTNLNNENSIGKKPCVAYEVEVELESFGRKEIIFMLGAEESILESKNKAYKYSKIQNCMQEKEKIRRFWKENLEKVQVYTPIESINIILNGWAIYQTISSRLLAKTGYYQSGGAYGFRDQLQDTLALKYISPDILKNQIIKHSKHQFIEGDVEHWWHEETQRGIRTRFSDDLLWLVYLTLEYIEFTGDKSLLEIETPFLQGEKLPDGVDERYDKYVESKEIGTIYEHCERAIEKSLKFGENGLPLIGSGDWNDGLNTVGNKGKGESIWLGFFMYNILDRWIKIIEEKIEEIKQQENIDENVLEIEAKNEGISNDIQEKVEDEELSTVKENQFKNKKVVELKELLEKIEKYAEVKNNLKKALNTKGWDGRWFKRAYMDDGNSLGSMENDECRIDSIAQSWSVISNAGDNDKKYISIESLENHLVDKENGIIKLLDPPFEKGKLEPGYIKAYLPGVRENGGQYTHASCWVIIAEAMLGFGDKALEWYRMINPIEHARTKEAVQKYKVEPYVIPADIYGASNLAGRGGWTWYTGSASWYYKAGIEYILGLRIDKGILKINPCIPKEWKEYRIDYVYRDSIYHIKVKNENSKNTGEVKVTLDGKNVENGIILENTGIYNVEVEIL